MSRKREAIEIESSGYKEWFKRAELPMTLMGGTLAMQAAGEKYLPKDPLEEEKNYQNRLKRTTLFNVFKKTLIFLSGQVFKKEINFNDEFPQSLEMFKTDVDLNGASFNFFAKQLFDQGMNEGCVHILVESNNKGEEYVNKAEEKAANIRSYFRTISALDLFAWIVVDNKLVQVRLWESVTERVNEFEEVEVRQIRVLEPGTWKVYRQSGKTKKWLIHEEGTTSLDYIPLVTFIPGRKLSMVTGESPLIDLAELNLDHWQSKSDQKNILHIIRCPLLFMKLVDTEKVKQSVHTAIASMDKDADMKYIEHTGKSVEAGQKDISEIEAKMALFGLQQLIPRTGNQTATEKALSSAESNSALGSNVDSFESCLREALSIAADFENEKNYKTDSVVVNRDFTSNVLDPEIINAFASLVGNEILSSKNAFDELQRKGFISESLDWIENLTGIESQRNLGMSKQSTLFGK